MVISENLSLKAVINIAALGVQGRVGAAVVATTLSGKLHVQTADSGPRVAG